MARGARPTRATSKGGRGLAMVAIGVFLVIAAGISYTLLVFLQVIEGPAFMSSLLGLPEDTDVAQESEHDLLIEENKLLAEDLRLMTQKLTDREASVSALQRQVDDMTDQLAQLGAEQDRLSAMVPILGTMESGEAAAILSRLPDSDVFFVLTRLKKDQAADILSHLGSERAARLASSWQD